LRKRPSTSLREASLLADLIHNVGDTLTAVPLGVAFLLRSVRAERSAGFAVVGVIFISACVALYETIARLIHPEAPAHLVALGVAGVVGFLGNEAAAAFAYERVEDSTVPRWSRMATTLARKGS
jgi:divalent metal cation (Fe/Co/Zn/Cd) transporter